MPKEVAAKLKTLSSTRGAEGERRIVTILFCDVKGSTAIAEKLDPEEWAGIMNAAFEYLVAPVYRFEGTVARLLGDGLLAFFGAPIAHEDDPERAILAGLAITEGIDKFCQRFRRERGMDFEVRVGVNTGLVVVGDVGSDLKYEYTAMGDAINLAARIQTAAEPNTVLISENTYRFVSSRIEFEDRGMIQFKGKEQPVHVYRVTGERQDAIRARGIAGLTSPMVGRRREFSALMQLLEEVRSGHGSIIAIIGEAGLGKSRLVAEWKKAAFADVEARPLRWFEGRCLSYGGSIAHHFSISILRQLIGAPGASSEEETRVALRKTTEDLFGAEMQEVYPFLGHLLGLQLEEDMAARVKYLGGPALQGNYVASYKRLLQAMAQATPLVIVCEDVHWADPSSVELMMQVLTVVTDAPIVFALLTRPEQDAPGWKLITQAREVAGAGAIQLYLAQLAEADTQELVSNLLHLQVLPENLRRLILSKAEGNPFFVEEVVRMLIDHGGIQRQNSHWVSTSELLTIAIPDTLQGVLLARMDRLPEPAKRTLQVASVIGRKFQERVLERVIGEGQHEVLQNQLGTLESSGLIRMTQENPEHEYTLRHALTQEAAYESLLKHDRKQLHLMVGQVLEQLYADRLDEYAPRLVQHYAEAGDDPKTVEYATRAGDNAMQLYAYTEAREYYAKALDALSDLPDTEDNRRRRVDVIVNLVTVSYASDSPGQNLARLEEVEHLAKELPDPSGRSRGDPLRLARIHYWMGQMHLQRNEPREALGYYQQVLAVAPEVGDEQLRAVPASMIGRVMFTQGQFGKAASLFTPTLGVVEKKGEWEVWVTTVGYIGSALAAQGRYADALMEGQRMRARAEETKNLTSIGLSHIYSSLIYFMGGDYQASAEESRAALEATEKSGDRIVAYIGHGFEAWAESRLGHHDAASQSMAQWKAVAETLGGRLIIADWFAAAGAELAFNAGRYQEARPLAEEATTLAKSVNGLFGEGEAQRVWGQALAALDPESWPDAEIHLAASIQPLESGEAHLEAARTHVVWGVLLRDRDDKAAAREHFEKAAAQFESSGLAVELQRARDLIAGL